MSGFQQWLCEIDRLAAVEGCATPYTQQTGSECWREQFEAGVTPAEAWREEKYCGMADVE